MKTTLLIITLLTVGPFTAMGQQHYTSPPRSAPLFYSTGAQPYPSLHGSHTWSRPLPLGSSIYWMNRANDPFFIFPDSTFFQETEERRKIQNSIDSLLNAIDRSLEERRNLFRGGE